MSIFCLLLVLFVGRGVDKWHSCEAPSQPAQNSHYDYFPGDTPAAPTFQMHIVSSMIVQHGEENYMISTAFHACKPKCYWRVFNMEKIDNVTVTKYQSRQFKSEILPGTQFIKSVVEQKHNNDRRNSGGTLRKKFNLIDI